MAKIKKKKKVTATNAYEDEQKLGFSYAAIWNVHWYSHSGKQFGVF